MDRLADALLIGGAIFGELAVLVVLCAVVWMAAKATQAWVVAIGRAQQLNLAAYEATETIRAQHEGLPEEEVVRRPRMDLIDDVDDRDLVDAARRNGRRVRRPDREMNANENASKTYIDGEVAFHEDATPGPKLD